MIDLDNPAMPIRDLNEHPGPFGLTIRQHAAITLRVPMSGDEELDAMIREARRLDMATAAMQGACTNPASLQHTSEGLAKTAFNDADALLAVSEPKKADQRDDANTCTKCGHWNGGPVLCKHYEEEAERRERERQAQPDAEGWIEWHGGECPVRWDTCVEIKCRNGEKDKNIAGQFYWKDDGDDCDIIAYRVVE